MLVQNLWNMIQIIFIFSESFNDPSGPMDGSIIGLEETISITADHLHSIKLLSSRQKPWRQNVLNSIAEPLDTLFMELYLASGLYDKKKIEIWWLFTFFLHLCRSMPTVLHHWTATFSYGRSVDWSSTLHYQSSKGLSYML